MKMKINTTNIETYTLPILPVRGLITLPHTEISLEIGRNQSIEALEAASTTGNYIMLISQLDNSVEFPQIKDLSEFGTIAKIVMKIKLPNGHYKVKFKSIIRAKVEEFIDVNLLFEAKVKTMPTSLENDTEEQALVNLLMNEALGYGNVLFHNPAEAKIKLKSIFKSPDEAADLVTFYLRIPEEKKRKYLPMTSLKERIRALLVDIEQEKQLAELEIKINQEVKNAMDKHQKEFYLREKVRAIHKELGEENSKEIVALEFRNKVKELGMPQAVEEKVLEEISRFEILPGNSSESGIVRTYIEWLLALPWQKATTDNQDIAFAEKTLNEQHYGLEKVKDRILEYLAVKVMTGKNPATILCLVGPPGVGKTSLAQSIAESLGRNFVKISLGGVRDEAEIRGHRRTYLGALPGRLIQGMKRAETINPVFLLDEIDKMSSDYKGDPASAMLEVLDPEQNKKFSDHYLEEEYDLSKVLFIATANELDRVPPPLKDRMDIIHVTSYTEPEKFEIAKRYLSKRQLKAHGLTSENLMIEDAAITDIIRYYTREAGVRQLERTIGALCRKAAKRLLNEKITSITVDQAKLVELLGQHKFVYGLAEVDDQVGAATGLAYTQFGGDILPVEVSYYKGKGKVVLTGKLGDVMKESAQIALSYVRAHAKQFGIEATLFEKNDFHIHVPEGATPKDGPSAGITMATAIVSALTERKTVREVGMTGEVTLRGRVLAIGGLKEKSISAHRSGLKKILIPKDNKKDLEDIPKTIQEELDIVLVATMDEVLEHALR